jgi:hypothetical protein
VTGRAADCPSCGAPVAFRWSGAVQTTCDHCRSVLVRHDVDLVRVGTVADVAPDSSPVQRGSEGRWRGRPFVVVGRIRYAHGRGRWSEWHLRFADGGGGWLSDAQLEWAVTEQVPAPARLPGADRLRPGREVEIAGRRYTVASVTRARYDGVEGELPFFYWGKDEVPYADLRDADGRFATVDHSERPPLVFAGEFADFGALAMTNLRAFDGWPAPR